MCPARINHARFQLKSQEFWSGILFASVGVIAVYLAYDYDIGRPARMGPGFFPLIVGALLIAVGVTLVGVSLVSVGQKVSPISSRVFVAILSVIAFAFLIRPAGLIVAVAATVWISSIAGRGFRLIELILLPAGLAIAVWLIFRVGLGMPVPVLPF